MGYLVLARKYRPQSFADMTGQEHVVQTLSNALTSDRVAHALLFCGPRGCGKTTTARIVAKALNCEHGPTPNPCGECSPCREIAAGTDVDVQEIDAASNTGVDNVRELRESAKYLPARDRFKIFIVDEVHMLSKAAFNAFLKTLEEPPGHVKFLFATTDPQALPDTILSRCQRHNFRLVPLKQITERIRSIAAAENIEIDDGAVALVARQAAGSMRDALSILDQLFSACPSPISEAQAATALGALDRSVVADLAGSLLDRNARGVLDGVARAYDGGHDLKRLAEDLATHLRNLIAARVEGAPLDLPDHEIRALVAQAGAAEGAELARLFDIVHGALNDISRAAQPRHALEIALLKAIYLAPSASVQSLLSRTDELLQRLGGNPPPRGGSGGGGPDFGAGGSSGGGSRFQPPGASARYAQALQGAGDAVPMTPAPEAAAPRTPASSSTPPTVESSPAPNPTASPAPSPPAAAPFAQAPIASPAASTSGLASSAPPVSARSTPPPMPTVASPAASPRPPAPSREAPASDDFTARVARLAQLAARPNPAEDPPRSIDDLPSERPSESSRSSFASPTTAPATTPSPSAAVGNHSPAHAARGPTPRGEPSATSPFSGVSASAAVFVSPAVQGGSFPPATHEKGTVPAFEPSNELLSEWPRIVDTVRGKRRMLASHLEHARPLALDETELALGFLKGDLHGRSISEEREPLEQLLSAALGRALRVKIVELDDGAATQVATLAESLDRADREARDARLRTGREHPAIQLVCSMLGAEVEDVRDLGGEA